MSLQKQVIFRVLSRVDGWNGVDVQTEVTLSEDEPQPDAQPISVVFRSLGAEDAAAFPAGQRVIIIVGADPAPEKLVTSTEAAVETTKGILATALDWLVGDPNAK